ncbi:MAG: hypothetical protein II750_09195 [Bacteroidaceae bacterium]|nr:hypothetical protein [Bacteroidaceae bacterium]
MMRKDSTKQTPFLLLTCTIIGIIEALLALQGFCMADEGWSLSGYQQIYHDPESVSYIFLFYNALWIGGLWEELFGSWGIYGFRILNILFIVASWAICYLTVSNFAKRATLIASMLMIICAHNYGVMVFDHSSVTVLLSVASIYMMCKALSTHSRRHALVFGLCVGINIFSRIPNVSQLALLLLFIPYYIFNRNIKQTLRLMIPALAGIVAGIGLLLLLMWAMGHLPIFADNLQSGFSAASSADSSHNLATMAGKYFAQYIQVVKDMVKVMLPPLLFHEFDNIMYLYAFCTLMLLTGLWCFRHEPQYVYTAMGALIVLYTLPLGSDYGINNMGENAIWTATPLALATTFMLARQLKSGSTVRQRLRWWMNCYVMVVGTWFCIIFICMNSITMSRSAYFDYGPRMEKTFRIDHPLANTYTSEAYKLHTDKILSQLSHYVNQGDYLFCFQNRPMLHYLTHTRPYMHNPWPWSYDNSMMELNMRQAEQRTEQRGEPWPVILREKGETIDFTQPDPLWNSTDATDDFMHKNRKVELIQQFIARHNYSVVWEDEDYQILCVR